ncbi:hypothetical protein ACQ4LE_000774, partial [Meloidogyne hapla]
MINFQRLPSSDAHPVLVHPLLQQSKVIEFSDKELEQQQRALGDDGKEKFLDPLGAASPLSVEMTSATLSKGSNLSKEKKISPLDNTLLTQTNIQEEHWESDQLLVGFRPWKELKQRILDQFKTDARLSLQNSFLYFPEGTDVDGKIVDSSKLGQKQLLLSSVISGKNKRQVKEQSTPSIKFVELTQEEWCRKLGELRFRLKALWREEKRLDCIKLISELLAQLGAEKTTCSAQFYPVQFVYITDLLDFFGRLVWLRLLQCAQEERRQAGLGDLPLEWNIGDILEGTRLKARNWFGKINQIVKIVSSRIYMLAAILPCQRFMDPWPQAAQQNALELCHSISSAVKHPLVSIYLRCYLCRVSMRIQPTDKAPHWKCLNDWLQTFDSQPPCSLLWPAMEWIIQCAAYRAVIYEDLHPLWEYCKRIDKRPIVLIPLINALPRLYFGEYSLEVCKIVVSSELVTGEELCALGSRLLEIDVPRAAKKPILRSSWKCVLRLGSTKEYLSCCDYWCQFVVRHFTKNELEVMLESIFRKLQHDKYEPHFVQLLSIWSNIFNQSIQIKPLLEMEIFSKFFVIFRAAPATLRIEAAKVVLNGIVKRHLIGEFKNVNDAYQIFSVCQLLHDSLELSAPLDQISENTKLICFALDRISLQVEEDPEQCLNFLVDCRANFPNWDIIQRWTIRRVQSLTLLITRKVKFSSSRAAFIQGCLANQFVSIPSLSDPLDRIEISIQSAHIALIALDFIHVDAFLNFALEQISNLQSSSFCDSKFLQIVAQFFSILLIIPEMDDFEEVDNYEKSVEIRIPFKYFDSFLHSLLSFQFQEDFSSKNVSIPSTTFHSNRIILLNKCLQFLLILNQKTTQNVDNLISENIQKIVDLIGGEFSGKENIMENEPLYSAGIQLLELIAYFDINQSFPCIYPLAKQIYKIIRYIPSLSLRL